MRLPVSHYICLWAAVFCGQIWSSYFKLVYSTIWRNSFQPKHLINSELRWPCLCFATCKSWTQWQNKDKCTSILDQVSASSHPIMTTPDLIFTTLSHPISFHSTLWQSMKTWRKKKIYTHTNNKICLAILISYRTNLRQIYQTAENRDIWKP